MSAYRTGVVGTDGSESSLRAVARAGALAGAGGATTDRGVDGSTGRLLGSVPAVATRRSEVDVLVVRATG